MSFRSRHRNVADDFAALELPPPILAHELIAIRGEQQKVGLVVLGVGHDESALAHTGPFVSPHLDRFVEVEMKVTALRVRIVRADRFLQERADRRRSLRRRPPADELRIVGKELRERSEITGIERPSVLGPQRPNGLAILERPDTRSHVAAGL